MPPRNQRTVELVSLLPSSLCLPVIPSSRPKRCLCVWRTAVDVDATLPRETEPVRPEIVSSFTLHGAHSNIVFDRLYAGMLFGMPDSFMRLKAKELFNIELFNML